MSVLRKRLVFEIAIKNWVFLKVKLSLCKRNPHDRFLDSNGEVVTLLEFRFWEKYLTFSDPLIIVESPSKRA